MYLYDKYIHKLDIYPVKWCWELQLDNLGYPVTHLKIPYEGSYLFVCLQSSYDKHLFYNLVKLWTIWGPEAKKLLKLLFEI